jgi:hypothetical protein
LEIRQWISGQILETRAKDFRNPFKKATFRAKAEMEHVIGTAETNTFIKTAQKEDMRFNSMIETLMARL